MVSVRGNRKPQNQNQNPNPNPNQNQNQNRNNTISANLNNNNNNSQQSKTVLNENFEYWIRLATDNKINATNSWNVELIDYFHDFNVLKDGNSVNFQKASATLDGCMKIYSHRIDSAAKDTGILISSININANKTNKKKNHDGEDNSDDDNDSSDEEFNEESKKPKAKQVKIHKAVAETFNPLKLKDSDRPFKPDPVFKKALSDFDEGGAKGLLNNILRVSNIGKIVFDLANSNEPQPDEIEDEDQLKITENECEQDNDTKNNEKQSSMEFQNLKKFITFDLLGDSLNACPSLNELNDVKEGKTDAAALLESIDQINVTLIEEERAKNILTFHSNSIDKNNNDQKLITNLDSHYVDLPTNDFDMQPDFDMDIGVEDDNNYNYKNNHFEQNEDGNQNGNDNENSDEVKDIDMLDVNDGENQKSNNSNPKETRYSLFNDGIENSQDDQSGPNVTLNRLFGDVTNNRTSEEEFDETYHPGRKVSKTDMALINFFDDASVKPSTFWKIARLRKSVITKAYERNHFPEKNNEDENSVKMNANKQSIRKNRVLIDFMNDDNDVDADKLFEPPEYLSKTILPEKDRKLGKHLLDDGFEKLSAKTLAFLSIKPHQLINTALLPSRKNTHEEFERDKIIAADETYFAKNYQIAEENQNKQIYNTSNNNILDNLSNDFEIEPDFDFDPNGVEGFDAPLTQTQTQSQYQLQSQTQSHRTNPISYSRRSKKVDVKLLKHNIWESIEEISIHKKKRPASHFEDSQDEGKIKTITDGDSGHKNGNIDNEEKETNSAVDKTDESDNKHDGSEISNDISSSTNMTSVNSEKDDEMNFTNVVKVMASKYSGKTKNDLSTSFCFICLLHLANENSLTLETMENNEDIIIHK